ncbi:MAG: KH domain-containing protein [Chloracidobacterium sp.]
MGTLALGPTGLDYQGGWMVMVDVVRLVEHLARGLVDAPEAVSASAELQGQTLLVKLTVAPPDVGKVIGRQGRTIMALRSLLSSTSAAVSRRVLLEVVE